MVTSELTEKSNKSILLKAPVTSVGFFGINQLHDFFFEKVDPVFSSNTNHKIVLDFSAVVYWDISALLWLIIALDYYKKTNEKNKNSFQLLFPEPKSLKDNKALRSADYLRRWKFINALKNLSADPSLLLVESQKQYLNGEPKKFYLERKIGSLDGIDEKLISLHMVEIRNLVDLKLEPKDRRVNRSVTNQHLEWFIQKSIASVLHTQCGIEVDTAQAFITDLLYEGLENALQHPNATIGMMSISRIGVDKLVLAIADNGESICKTIFEHFRRHFKSEVIDLPVDYPSDDNKRLSVNIKRDIINHATKEGVSRKFLINDQKQIPEPLDSSVKLKSRPGIGLTNIRDQSISEFGGNLVVVTDGVGVKFVTPSKNTDIDPSVTDFHFKWPGNLLRIQIQIKSQNTYSNLGKN